MDKNIDLHCDLTSYLAEEGTSPDGDIRCSVPKLVQGDVKMQVMAFYSSAEKGSVKFVQKQIKRYLELLRLPVFYEFTPDDPKLAEDGIGLVAAVENASGLCEADQPISEAALNFSLLNAHVKLMYVGLTHHLENRFGGGNFSDVGLKDDGRYVIELLHQRKIAVDLSHTSDRLAFDMLNFIDQNNLEIPVIASHSNMRAVFDHKRNLPDELVQEVIRRRGLIGLNFVKYFINPENPEDLYRHIEHALKMGAENHLCFGADFFDDKAHPDQERYPYFFEELGTPSAYNMINRQVEKDFSPEFMKKMSHGNVLNYFHTLYDN